MNDEARIAVSGGGDLPYRIHTEVAAAVNRFKMPEELGFGRVNAPVMYSCAFERGEWQRGELLPYGPISVMPNARSLQYAEQVAEGMKVYRCEGQRPHLFRPAANFARFARSAARLSMPIVPKNVFIEGVTAVASSCASLIPMQSGASLYLRPTLFSVDAGYSLTGSNSYRFMVLASPSDAYASGPMRVCIERKDVRAARSGLGNVKTGANYAAAMRATSDAVKRGYTVALWLDPVDRENIEELSGMNLFAVIDGELHTPALTDSILSGITRDSVMTLARERGMAVHERALSITDVLRQVVQGRCTEIFATGTAAIVAPISEIGDADGKVYALSDTATALTLREALLSIQERRAPDLHGWTVDV